ncbi:alpha/beta fold hydrolase, partial [Paraburkholderia sp. BR14261]
MASIKQIFTSVAFLGGLFALQAAHAAPPQDLKGTNVVLVHGAFADGSSWNRVIPLLEARGLHVVAVQNPLSSLADDAAATKRVIEQQKGPVVLVGHSWAGVVISEAGNDEKVKSLVYVAAFAPDNGQSIADITQGQPDAPWASELRKDSAGYLTLSDKAIREDFAPDLPPAQQRIVAAT